MWVVCKFKIRRIFCCCCFVGFSSFANCIKNVFFFLFFYIINYVVTCKRALNLLDNFQHLTDGNCFICKKKKLKLEIKYLKVINNLLSSRNVKRPIWGKSLNCSKQINPEHSTRIIATWSCLTNLGRVFDLSPLFLSTRHIRA